MQRLKNLVTGKDKKNKKDKKSKSQSSSAATVKASTNYVKEDNVKLKKGNELEALGNEVRSKQSDLLELCEKINSSMKTCATTLQNIALKTTDPDTFSEQGNSQLKTVETLSTDFSDKLLDCKEKYDTYIGQEGQDIDIKNDQATLAMQLNRNNNFFIHPLVMGFKDWDETRTHSHNKGKTILS